MGIKRPEFVFFADEADRQAAVSAQRSEEYAARALAVGEVKARDGLSFSLSYLSG